MSGIAMFLVSMIYDSPLTVLSDKHVDWTNGIGCFEEKRRMREKEWDELVNGCVRGPA